MMPIHKPARIHWKISLWQRTRRNELINFKSTPRWNIINNIFYDTHSEKVFQASNEKHHKKSIWKMGKFFIINKKKKERSKERKWENWFLYRHYICIYSQAYPPSPDHPLITVYMNILMAISRNHIVVLRWLVDFDVIPNYPLPSWYIFFFPLLFIRCFSVVRNHKRLLHAVKWFTLNIITVWMSYQILNIFFFFVRALVLGMLWNAVCCFFRDSRSIS